MSTWREYFPRKVVEIDEGSIEKDSSKALEKRIKAIDQFRGFSIICMVIINFGTEIQSVPSQLKHVPDIGLNFADLGSPVFILAIGMTYGLSFRKRAARDGLPATIGHFIRRYLAILGIGALFSAGQTFLGQNSSGVDWGVLQAIGFSGLITLLVILLPMGVRLAIGLGMMAAYQILLDTFWLDRVLGSPHGGFIGSLSWAAFLIIATVFGDIFQNETYRKYFPWISLLFFLAGFALATVVPISKNRVSVPYDLVTLGFGGIVFSEFYLTKFDLKYFVAWGQNPMLLYVLSLVLTGLFVLPDIPQWHVEAPLWLVGLQVISLVFVLGLLAVYWQKREIRISI